MQPEIDYKSVDTIAPELTRGQEDALLKMGYAAMLHERWPVSENSKNCFNRENAYLHHLETEYFEIPDYLKFDQLKADIPEKHAARISKIWEKVQEHRRKLHVAKVALTDHWGKAPKSLPEDPFLDKLMNDPPVKLRREFRAAVRAQITIDNEGVTQPNPTRIWQMHDKGNCRQVYEELKNYTLALRLYYSMLLERSQDKSESVLPSDHPFRADLVIRTRYLELLDAVHQSLSGSKAAHHQQPRGRLRKTELKPYVLHELDVTAAMILDVMPHIIEEDRLPLSTVPLALIGPVHDLAEDTNLSIQDVIRDFVARLVDRYDSSLNPVIESGFGQSRLEIKRKILDLVGNSRSARLMQILRILSNNTILKPSEKKAALDRHIARIVISRVALDIPEGEIKSWGIDATKLPKTANTFRRFKKNHDNHKMTRFLLRLSAITKNEQTRQMALIIKLEDRASNIADLSGMPTEKQFSTLRSTTTRLIAWCMLDHDRKQSPLYNALPRLIDVTIPEYERVARQYPEITTEEDHQYISQLKEWALQVERFEISKKIKTVLEDFDQKAA